MEDQKQDDVYTYMGITAHKGLWLQLGMRPYSNVPFSESRSHEGHHYTTDGELIEARIASGSTGEAALVWLIQERRRRREEEARTRALAKQGDDMIHAARIQRQVAEIEYETKYGKDSRED